MPYKDKDKDRTWHRDYMRRKRGVTPEQKVTPVTPTVEPIVTPRLKPTAEAIPSTNLKVFDDYIDVIESPTIPPKKEFQVKLIVRSIQKRATDKGAAGAGL